MTDRKAPFTLPVVNLIGKAIPTSREYGPSVP